MRAMGVDTSADQVYPDLAFSLPTPAAGGKPGTVGVGVMAYYGGNDGNGADYSGWYFDAKGDARGFGQHPPGSSFKVYDLAEALRQNISLDSKWDSPPTKEFPASGRVKGSPAGPVRNSSTAACQPDCTLTQATVASLNVPFFDLTEHLGVGNVITMAGKAGIDNMWANVAGTPTATRVDLRGKTGAALAQSFSTEVGIGQYGITVEDHANGMATFAAGGKRAQAHFVRSVSHGEDTVYQENLTQTDIGLSADQVNQLDATLKQVTAGQFDKAWDAASKTGTWQYGTSTSQNAHAWTVGYTRALAAAVWVGTKDGGPLLTKNGATDVYGATFPGPIYRQFMVAAAKALKLDPAKFKFVAPTVTPSPTPSVDLTPTPSEEPTTAPTPTVKPTPTPTLGPTPTIKPTGKPTVPIPTGPLPLLNAPAEATPAPS